jgi:hypothetical protein
MGKVFEFNANNGFIDQVTGTVGDNTNGEIIRGEKGSAWKGINANSTHILCAVPFSLNQDWSVNLIVKTDKDSVGHLWHAYFGIGTAGYAYSSGMNFNASRIVGWDGGVVAGGYQIDPQQGEYVILTFVHVLSEKKIYFYKNGADNWSDTYTGTLLTTPTHMYVGFGAGTYYLNGEVALAQVYDHILTEKERAKMLSDFHRLAPTTKIIQ